MPIKSKWDLTDSHMVRIPKSIWDKYVKRYENLATEEIRDILEVGIGVEEDNDGHPKD